MKNPQPTQKEIDEFVDAAMGANWAVEGVFLDRYPAFIDAKHSITHQTALMTAAHCGRSWSVWKLLQMGASIDLKDDNGRTELMLSVMNGHTYTAESLLANGKADINAKDKSDTTALMLAAERGHRETVEMLLEKGALLEEKNIVGWEAVDFARTAAFGKAPEMVEVLEQWLKTEKKKKHEKWLRETDFSQGLKRDLPAPKPIKKPFL